MSQRTEPAALLPSPFTNLCSLLLRQPSVVGAEHAFFRLLARELEERGARVTWYEGLLVAQGSDPLRVMFSAHADRHGLMCTGPGEFQYAAFIAGARSDLLGNSVSELMMRKVVDRFQGVPVYGYEPWTGAYLGRGHIHGAYICERRSNLIFEVDGLSHLVAGTPVALNDRLRVDTDTLMGQLDNLLGVAALVYLFELGFEGTAFFTAEEEAGKSWRYLLEWFRRFGNSTNQLIVVDTSPFPDMEAATAQHLVMRNKDANAAFNEDVTSRVAEICNRHDYTTMFKDVYVEEKNAAIVARGGNPVSLGSTELGRIVAASQGVVDGTTLQVPTTGYHTLEEAAPLASVAAFLDVLAAVGFVGKA